MTLFRPAVPLLVLALALAACAVPGPPSRATASPAEPAATAAPAGSPAGEPESPAPESGAPAETEPPAETEAPAATEPPAETPEPVESPEVTEPDGSAAACTGSDDNRSFLEGAADQLDWTVLCAVLPSRWSVVRGEYRLADGGRLVMSYRGPGGSTLALSQGAFCREADGCVPPGTDAGDAALGPMTGTLVALDDGGWAIVVDRGEELSWLLETQGLDEAATRALAAAVASVG